METGVPPEDGPSNGANVPTMGATPTAIVVSARWEFVAVS